METAMIEAIRKEYAPLIRTEIEQHFPELLKIEDGELIIHAQIMQESSWNPNAESACGARGLMQLMPATDKEIDGDYDGFDPAGNIDNGVRYLAFLYRRFTEILDPLERICFALAAYNCGRGYVNKALEIARSIDGHPAGYSRWVYMGRTGGRWQRWNFTKQFFSDPRCAIGGKRPDARQVTDYVAKNMIHWRHYVTAAEKVQA
jgi:membrane-bound lytic murein transglycosylase MltF